MRRIALAAAVVSALMLPTAASAITFGDWASDNGYSPGDVMPGTVYAWYSSIDSLDGIGDYNWTTTPTMRLYLDGNQISSVESSDFSGLTSLDLLSLQENQLSSIESGDFGGLTNLERLLLRDNQISSIESGDFSGLTNLEHLSLSRNQISSIESGSFNGLANLNTLGLSNNQILSIESGSFNELANLNRLEFENNQISSIESGDFSGLTNLRYLGLNGMQLSSIESGDFSGPTNLTELYLNRNQISSIESGDFSGLTNLRFLGLVGNQISSIESGDFSGPTNLEGLFLEGNQISSVEASDFSGLTNLKRLELTNNQISSIESGTFSGLAFLEELWLHDNASLIELNLAQADFSSLTNFRVGGNVNITSVSLRNAVVNQTSLEKLLLAAGSDRYGIGELDADITEMDLSGIDYGSITDLAPLYVMDDLTDLWLVDTVNLDAAALDVLLDNLATIEGTGTEGILHMTQANFDAFNSAGGGLLATWDGESGHHVEFVAPGDFNVDGTYDGLDFLKWQRGESPDPLSASDLADWEANYGMTNSQLAGDFNLNGIVDGEDFLLWQRNPSVGSLADWEANYGMVATLSATSAAVPEPTTTALALAALCLAMISRRSF